MAHITNYENLMRAGHIGNIRVTADNTPLAYEAVMGQMAGVPVDPPRITMTMSNQTSMRMKDPRPCIKSSPAGTTGPAQNFGGACGVGRIPANHLIGVPSD